MKLHKRASTEYSLAMSRCEGRCECSPRNPSVRCLDRATDVIEDDDGVHAFCEGCRRTVFGLTPHEKSKQTLMAAKHQTSLFGGKR